MILPQFFHGEFNMLHRQKLVFIVINNAHQGGLKIESLLARALNLYCFLFKFKENVYGETVVQPSFPYNHRESNYQSHKKNLKNYRYTSLYTTNKSWSATISTSNGTSYHFIDFSGPVAGFSEPTRKMIMMQVQPQLAK